MASAIPHKLVFVFAMSTAVPAASALSTPVLAAQRVDLLSLAPRDAQVCGGISDLQQCGSSLPSDFCCPSSSTCLQLNNTAATNVICCPSGSDCKLIAPVKCDVSLQNASLYPRNPLHSSNLDVKLESCGEGCCPQGYACQNGKCAMLPSTSASPSPSSSGAAPSTTSSQGLAATSTPARTSSSTAVPTPIPATAGGESGDSFSGRSFAAGFVPGIVIGALLLWALFWALKERRKRKNRYSGDFGPVSYNVSDPIYNPILAARTDFLRRGSTLTPQKPSPGSSLGTTTLLNNSNSKSSTSHGGIQEAYQPYKPGIVAKTSNFFRSPRLRQDPYETPTRTPGAKNRPASLARSGSTETIDVLMPAPSFLLAPPPALRADNGRPLTSDTTFTNLMANAGFGRDSQDGVRKMSARLQNQLKNT